MTRIHRHVSSSFKDHDGDLVEYFKGDEVKARHVKLLDGWGALEPLPGEESSEATEQPTTNPADPSAEPITGNYDDAKNTAALLQGEVDRRVAAGREIEVTGTGQGGNVLKGDLIKALEADDKAAQA